MQWFKVVLLTKLSLSTKRARFSCSFKLDGNAASLFIDDEVKKKLWPRCILSTKI